jgi:putative ABC transport system permease protein
MRKLVLRGLAARKVRAILTAVAVVLGVAMVSGTYVLTDTINSSFDQIFRQGESKVDVEVAPHEVIKNAQSTPPAFPASYADRVRAVKGANLVVPGIFGDVSILTKKGRPLQAHGGAPNFVASVSPPAIDAFRYVAGRQPAAANEAALDKFTADRHQFRLGDTLAIAGHGSERRYKIVGIAKYGTVSSFGGASIAIVTLPEAQILTGNRGKLQGISVTAEPGVSAQELKQRIRAALPAAVDVRTGGEQAKKQSSDIRNNLKFLRVALLAFAGVAVFVGGFIIFNTFSITVAQRKREFALLRTLGASRRQVLAAVVVEALAIGVLASALGLAAGVLYARGIRSLFVALGIDLPSSGTVIATRTIVVSLILGVAVTVGASLVPAVRATRVAPLEALREGMGATRVRRARVTAFAGALIVLGVAVMIYGLFGVSGSSGALSLIGLGAVAMFLGTAILSPSLVRPLASLAGAPLVRLRGLTGQLARENAMRNPGRTAVTAAALMIGLALVTFVAVFAAGLKAGIGNTIDQNFRGDFVLQNTNGFEPIPAAAGQAVARIPGVALVSPWRASVAKVQGAGGTKQVTGLDTRTANRALSFNWRSGSPQTLSSLGPNDAVIDKGFGDKEKIKVGDVMHVTTPTGAHLALTVKGAVKDNANFIGDFIVPLGTLTQKFGEKRDSIAVVKLAPGANVNRVRNHIDALLAAKFPTAESLNQRQLKAKQASNFNQLLALVYALLSLAVIVSIFGIVNTLVLTIHERTRELGLLRAVGMSRRQVRRMIRYESVITALIGAILGAVLGMLFALIVSRPIADEGFVLTFPVASIVTFLLLAAIAGVLAAILPARRASRLDVLDALAYE